MGHANPARDEPARARDERPVNACEIEEYQIWKGAGFDAMTSRRERRTRICYVESGPKVVAKRLLDCGLQGAMPEVHNYKEVYCSIFTK